MLSFGQRNPALEMTPVFSFTTQHPSYPHPITVDSGADTPAAALKSIQRFIGRENKRLMEVNHLMARRRAADRLNLVRVPRTPADLRHEVAAAR
jgi:hypothetical protein